MSARKVRLGRIVLGGSAVVAASLATAGDQPRVASIPTPSGWRQHDVHRPKPTVAEPADWSLAAPAPPDAVVLFDGRNLDAWESASGGPAEWTVADGGFAVAPGKGAIRTKEEFGDVQIHLEWASPDPAVGTGQNRGNSGLFVMGAFELQIIDSYKADTYADGMAGALYGQYPPLYNATKPPGAWQAYDIAFRAPRFSPDGALREPARVSAFLNGVLVQDNESLVGGTSWLEAVAYEPGVSTGPIELQDHGHPVKFRNIWLRKLPERRPPTDAERQEPKVVALPAAELDALAGSYAEQAEERGLTIEVTRQGDDLLMRLPFRATPLRIVPIAPLQFVLPYTQGGLTFEKDEKGRAKAVQLTIGDGSPRPLKRVEK
ncbi:family 16 glycoside hydrolase [Planctomyces sp. SH-PL62]|uniref:family 16 glycoside hydrolase n=1 Tax=Planctomyces sp. SH-PL62 TaxID=1636152 RepID=UPI00078E80AA|nr:family 16 glycoside hydrolase [Planctomyces sp. SH-PL62]AMV40411.1 hypothetical protein VT85_23470 [Planctomyces sp. SH-PL62]